LRGDPTQATRDRYSRLLAYVWLPGGKDLGFQLISGDFAKVYVFDKPFKRLSAYRAAENSAKAATGAGRGVWGACGASPAPAPPPPPTANCHPSYSPCIPDAGYDLDCADIPFTVRVRGSDPYRLDGDNDGYGCE
jgi:nuclease-like protein